VRHLLIAKMRYKGRRGQAHSSHSCIDGRERQARRLRFHDAPAKQASSADKVLSKQLRHDMLDVRDVDLVDKAIDGFLERLPRHTLILFARLIRDLCL